MPLLVATVGSLEEAPEVKVL